MKIETFLNSLKEKNFSLNTIKTYYTVLKNILQIEQNSYKKIVKIIINNKYSSKSQILFKNVYISYLKFYKKYNLIQELKSIKTKKEGIIYRQVIEKEEIYFKTKINFNDSIEIQKYKLLIRFLFETGIRASELLTLELHENKIFVKGKGNKKRQIFFKESTVKSMLEIMNQLKFDKHIKTLRIKVKKILGSNYTLHSLRRSFATHMLTNGANPKMVMQQMGHSKIETTFSYLYLSEKKNQDIYDKFM